MDANSSIGFVRNRESLGWCSSILWRWITQFGMAWADELAADCEILLYDCRSHGQSDRRRSTSTPSRNSPMTSPRCSITFAWPSATIAGCSMGGCVAQEFAAAYPQRASAAVGREIFRVECQSCHTVHAYRAVSGYLEVRQWDQQEINAMLTGLDLMHNGVMPPFAGTDAERAALAAFLSTTFQRQPGEYWPGWTDGVPAQLHNVSPIARRRSHLRLARRSTGGERRAQGFAGSVPAHA